MTYFLIAFILLVALSPLITMRPSPRQRQIANFRQQAAIAGMIVQLQHLPEADDQPLQPFYGRNRLRGNRRSLGSAVYRREQDLWFSAAGAVPEATAELFKPLPEGVSHVCDTLVNVGVFWDERGSEEDLESINKVLKSLLG